MNPGNDPACSFTRLPIPSPLLVDRDRDRTGVPVGVYEPHGSSSELHGHKKPDGASLGVARISVRLNPDYCCL